MTPSQVGPGWIMLTRTGGLMGWAIRVFTHSSVNHAAVHVFASRMVEMDPKGAELVRDDTYPAALWVRPPGTEGQLRLMASAAGSLYRRHVGYSFVDIAAQFAWRVLHVRPRWLAAFISSDRRMVCSQAVDWCAQQANIHLFTDGRLNGLVSPGDLLSLAARESWPMVRQAQR